MDDINKKQLYNMYYNGVDVATCTNCGTKKYGIVGMIPPILITLDTTSRCCEKPDYHWR